MSTFYDTIAEIPKMITNQLQPKHKVTNKQQTTLTDDLDDHAITIQPKPNSTNQTKYLTIQQHLSQILTTKTNNTTVTKYHQPKPKITNHHQPSTITTIT
jgi:hypothetical protein